MTIITNKIAKNGNVNVYTNGKRNSLERLAKEIADATIPADSIMISGEKGNFSFAGMTEKISEYTGDVLTRTYTFKTLDGATVSKEIGAETPAYVAYREIIKTICNIPCGSAKYTPAPKEAELKEWNRRFDLTFQAECLAEDIKDTEYRLADPAFNTLDSSMLEYKAELQAECDTLKAEYAAVIADNPDVFNQKDKAEVDEEEYAISPEALDIATNAEIELANQTVTNEINNAETDGSEDDSDDNDEVFSLLPAIDELNDVEDTESNGKFIATQITFPNGYEGEPTRQVSATFDNLEDAARFIANDYPIIEGNNFPQAAYPDAYFGGIFFAGWRIEQGGKTLCKCDWLGNVEGDKSVDGLVTKFIGANDHFIIPDRGAFLEGNAVEFLRGRFVPPA